MSRSDHPRFAIEKLDEDRGRRDRCGRETRSVAGLVHDCGSASAAYWMHWTIGHPTDPGANLDLVLGGWGMARVQGIVS